VALLMEYVDGIGGFPMVSPQQKDGQGMDPGDVRGRLHSIDLAVPRLGF